MNDDQIIKKIKLLYPDLISNISINKVDDVIKQYLDNSSAIVDTYNPPKSIYDRLVMLLTCSQINGYYADDSQSIKVGQINLGYGNNSNDDPWMDDFNHLISEFGLTKSSIEGF